MRVSGQLAVIAVLGAAGFGGWYAYQGGHLAKAPVIGSYFAGPAPAGVRRRPRQARRRHGARQPSRSTPSRPAGWSRCVNPSARSVPSNPSP